MAMRRPRCIFNSAAALHRIFIAPIEQSSLLLTHRLPAPRTTSSPALLVQARRYAASPSPTERRLPHDDLIKCWSIRLVNEDGTLGEVRSTFDVLESLDRSTETLVQVTADETNAVPICKIMNKQAMREAEKARAKAARRGGTGGASKTLELNWAIDKNDLAHRMDRMRKFLQKGMKVEIVLASKRKGKQASEEEAEELLRSIKKVAKEMEGVKEVKPMEGKLLKSATLFFGRQQPAKDSVKEGTKGDTEDD